MKKIRIIHVWVFVLAAAFANHLSFAQTGSLTAARPGASITTNQPNQVLSARPVVATLAAPVVPASRPARTLTASNSVALSAPATAVARAPETSRLQPVIGGAKWSAGRTRTAFAANLAAASPVSITTPDRRELRCRPSFLAYYDTASGQAVLLGQVQSRVGALAGDDQVIYTNAFSGIKADVRYTCAGRSLEQDVILRQRPPNPADVGLDPQTTELQTWTEWFDAPVVATQARVLADGRVDEAVDFGSMKLVAGSAYAGTNTSAGTFVCKSWQRADGHDFLVESVPYAQLTNFLQTLPLTAMATPARPAFGSKTELVQAGRPAVVGDSQDKMELALAAPATAGVVLDFVIVASVPLPAGAVSWWPAGGDAQDALPAANHGSWTGTTAYGAGEVGQGFVFNGGSDVEVPDAASLNPTDGLTVEAWINENGHHYDHRDLVSKDGESFDRQFILTISRDYGTFRAHVSTASGLYYVDGQTVVQPGVWYHVAMTYDAASSNLLLYVNGQLEASGTVPGGALITTTQPVRIGGGAPVGNIPYYFTGSIDEPTIYDRALGASEIAAIYAAGGAGKDNPDCVAPPTGILGWWPGDQNALDYAGTNNGTLNNSPGYAPAVVAQGYTFAGYNNVSIPDAPELNPPDGLTVEAWVNENGHHYDHRDLVSKDGESFDRQFILTISRDYGTFRAAVSTANGLYYIDGQTLVQPGTWYHVAMTYDAASGSLLLYVNGELEASGTVPGGDLITTTQPVRIGGGAPTGYLQYYFTGSIDEPAIYGRALSAEEIGSLYAAGGAGKCKTDLDADGLPDAWENYWFGGYSHGGDELDASGARTLLYDYQNNLNPHDNFNPARSFYDFMHVKACAPLPALSWGFDLANYVPGDAPVLYTGHFGTPDHYEWPGPPELQNPWLKPMTFYRRRVTIETYVGWIGSSDANGNFTGQLVTKTVTTTVQGYPYYRNLWNLDQVEIDAQSDNVSPSNEENLDGTTDPSHSQDLRVCGFPTDFEYTTKTTFHASDDSGYADFHLPPGAPNNESGDHQLIWTQENSPPPTVTPTEVTQYFDSGNPPEPSGSPDTQYQTVGLASRTIRLEDAVSWGDYMNQIDALLNAVPLTPRTALTTREGPLYFDYFGLSDAYPDLNLLSNASYDFNTMEYSFNVTPDKVFGIQFGPNETGLPGSLVTTTTFIAGDARGSGQGHQLYPYYWDPNATYPEQVLCNGLSAPDWWTGNAMNNGTDIPSTCCFVSHTGNVTLHAGKSSYPQWQADTTYAAGTKITDANGHTEICTVAGHSDPGNEPAWATTLNGITTDNTVHWQAIKTPVTAIVSGGHVNQLVVFPLKSGSVIASDNTGCYAAVNSPNEGDLSYANYGLFGGFLKEKSLVGVPNFPESVTTDVANFNHLSGGVPATNILLNSYYQYDLSDNRLEPFCNLAGGEYLFGPADIQTPTGYGFLQFNPGAASALPVDVDVDVDSDNNNGLNPPDRSDDEDQIEDDWSLPGKIVYVNEGDADADGLPDFADGFNFDGIPGNEDDHAGADDHFVPVVLEVPPGMDVNLARLSIYYNASDPAGIYHDPGANTWTPAGGNLRLWLKDGDQARNKTSANAVAAPGDYVASGDYTLAQLGFTPVQNTITIYVEGIAPSGSTGDLTISVYLFPPWNGPWAFDEVRMTAIDPRLAVDANRDGSIMFDGTDTNSVSKPYRFWVNDASESGDVSNASAQIPGSSSPNYGLGHVNGRSDLVNFFPVALNFGNILQLLPPSNDWEYHLSQADSAVKFVYTSPTQGSAFDYLTATTGSDSYGVNGDEAPQSANTIQVSGTGTKLDANWLAQVQAYGENGVVLLEGCAITTQPLMLELWHNGQKLGGVPLYLSFSGVEQMYRQVNLRFTDGSTADPGEPINYPDSLANGKQVVFIHGFSVGENDARGWNAEVFKRLYQAHSRAMFTAVTWQGDDSPWFDATGKSDYYDNVKNAFMTASNFKIAVNGLPGSEKYIIAHSLGNMVVSSAIQDFDLSVNSYFALDAAVATESYDGDNTHLDMVYPGVFNTFEGWGNYGRQLWASDWHKLFSSGDGRAGLTWVKRFGVIDNFYNFYSSGEDVLHDTDGSYPNPLTVYLTHERPWVCEEMSKGDGLTSLTSSGSQAGWQLNVSWYIPEDPAHPIATRPRRHYEAIPSDHTDSTHININDLPTKPFFEVFNDGQVMNAFVGSTEAAKFDVRADILGGGIPALSHATGANSVDVFQDKNFDLMNMKTSWPQERQDIQRLKNRWLHSDFEEVAYPFVHSLFDNIVYVGGF